MMAIATATARMTQSLGSICDEVGGVIRTGPFGSQLHESDYTTEGTPVVMPKDLVQGRISEDTIARIDAATVERLSQHKLMCGDIVYGRRGDIGRRALITSREAGWLCGTGCLRISLGGSILDPQYLYYYLGQPDVVAWIANQAIGATLPNLNTSIIRSIEITYPPLPIQRKIAAILSAYDDLIENNTRRIALLEAMAQALYREWFVRFRFPGHESVPLVDSPLGPIPEGWRMVNLGDVAGVFRGRSYASSNLVDDGGLPFLNLKCIDRGGGFRYDGMKQYLGPYKESQVARRGDIIVAVTDMTQERRIVARAARVPPLGDDFSIFSMDLVRLDPIPGIPSEYVYGLLRYSGFADAVKQHANGANVLHLHPDRIADYEFALPSEQLQRRYADACNDYWTQAETLEQRNANLRRTRDLLLPKLVSGELDVADMEVAIGE